MADSIAAASLLKEAYADQIETISRRTKGPSIGCTARVTITPLL
jgi:hypothetical protein